MDAGGKKEARMKNILLIVTGCPGSGKTSFSSKLCAHYPALSLVSYDAVKEEFFDRYGFRSAAEKEQLNRWSLQEFYARLDRRMDTGEALLIEYPFCRKHRADLEALLLRHRYAAVTILLTGDMHVLYERGLRRDRSAARHPGHLLNAYRPGAAPEAAAPVPSMSYEQFVSFCKEKDYDIRLGHTLSVDVTSIQALDYGQIFSQLDRLLADGSL